MDIPWTKSVVEARLAGGTQGRHAHALMLSGVPGTGKRAVAAWLAKEHLGLNSDQSLPSHPAQFPEHSDLHWIRPPEDKHAIGIDQIRALVEKLNLTSYAGGGKVAVVEPADAMTNNAANSLLKTLEEPAGDALIVLVVDRLGRLPATILSRCQHLKIRVPSEEVGLQWLQACQPGKPWPKLLQEVGFAPIAALRAAERLDETEALSSDFAAVAEGRAAPLLIASKWAKHEPELIFGWVSRQIQSCIKRVIAGGQSGDSTTISDTVLRRIDTRNLFCYLDIINRLRSQPVGSFNYQLSLECLLIDWAESLKSVMNTE